MTTELQWGETPFDNLTRDELWLMCQRMYAAIGAMESCLNITKYFDSHSPYWGYDGSGGRALEMARQILDPINKEFDSKSIYRAFFRYANDLLFESNGYRIGFGWSVCPKCGTMLGESSSGEKSEGRNCIAKDCNGVLRPLEWKDLKTKAKKAL